jgi:hypothetical protein
MQPMWMDLGKVAVGLLLYGLVPLFGGLVLRGRPRLVPWMAGVMLILAALPPGWVTLSLFNREGYRGHSRGFEISLIDAVALSVLWWAAMGGARALAGSWRLVLPWLLYVMVAALGVVNALDNTLWAMAVWKNLKAALPLLAAYAAVGSALDLRRVVACAVAALLFQFGAGLWDRYVLGIYRISAWFEHSNSLAIWSYMMALPVLAAAMHPNEPAKVVAGRILAVLAGGGLAIMTLARGSMSAFAVGCAAILVCSVALKPSRRSALAALVLIVGLLFGLMRGLDSIQARIDGAASEEEVADFRVVLNRQSAEMFKDHALVGIGWNQYGLANSRPQGAYSWVIEEWNRERGHIYGEEGYTHNALTESLYWLHLAENGILGTTAYGLFLLVTLVVVLSAAWWRRNDLTGAVALGLFVALCIAYAHGTLERVLVQPKNLTTWLVLVAVVAGAARERKA